VSDKDERDIRRIMEEGTLVDRAIVRAHAEAVRRHRLLGVPLVIWRDGQVVEVSPDAVPIPGESGGVT
jgi:hypothetical protein